MSAREMDVDKLFVRLGIFGNPCGLPRESAVLTHPEIHVKSEVFEALEALDNDSELRDGKIYRDRSTKAP